MPVPVCPRSAHLGRPVPFSTVRRLVKGVGPAGFFFTTSTEWYFCPSPQCEVIWFDEIGTCFLREHLRVRVGLKETAPPRPICYCLGYTIEMVTEEFVRTGRSSILAEVMRAIGSGRAACLLKNPCGGPCADDIRELLRREASK